MDGFGLSVINVGVGFVDVCGDWLWLGWLGCGVDGVGLFRCGILFGYVGCGIYVGDVLVDFIWICVCLLVLVFFCVIVVFFRDVDLGWFGFLFEVDYGSL